MGYKIKVNHSVLTSTAEDIDEFNTKMSKKMANADRTVKLALAFWKGQDATDFKNKWETVKDNESTYIKCKKSLENYSNALKTAADKYKYQQAVSINEAHKLPKW